MTNAFRYWGILCFGAACAAAADDPRVSGPYTHDNLAVFLLHSGRADARGAKLLTLREAMEASRFNQRIAARMLGLTYYQLRHHLKVHGLLAKPSQAEDQPPGDQSADARTVTGVET